MAIPGETVGFAGAKCSCGRTLDLMVCKSAGGFYIGYECYACGPYSRETPYFATKEQADSALAAIQSQDAIEALAAFIAYHR